ncbi:MAG: twin-arginine translocation signal domain-containing protein, partial [Thermoproteus sp.]|nr:twin-arginine translocation signal domain-containing protein [Thermoproteus sp.]
LNRRDFLKLTGTAAVVAGAYALLSKELLASKLFEAASPQDQQAGDVVAFSTCYMCLGRCTFMYHITPNQLIRYARGDIYGFVNEGATCPIGPAAALYYLSPARVKYPMLRVPTAERGEGKFIRISWDDMFDILINGDDAALLRERGWKYGFLGMKKIYECCPEKFTFVTGRDQYNPIENTYFGQMFGTPHQHGHGGFCAQNVAAGGSYILGSTWWEYGYWDAEYTKVLILAGVTQDHFPTGFRRRIIDVKERGGAVIGLYPDRQPNPGPILDIWVPMKPGYDGLYVSSLIYQLLTLHEQGMRQNPPRPYIDEEYLKWYTNAAFLVITNPDGTIDVPKAPNVGLFLRMKSKSGEWMPVWRGSDGNLYPFMDLPWQNGVEPVLDWEGDVAVPVGPDSDKAITVHVKTAFKLLKERFLAPDYAPENAAAKLGIDTWYITYVAQLLGDTAMREPVILSVKWTDYLGRRHDYVVGRPVSAYIMRGISAHTNGFNTARLFGLLLTLLGAVDTPGGYRHKPPYPKPIPDGDYWPAYGSPSHPWARITQDDVNSGEVPATGPNGESLVGSTGAILINERVYNDGTVAVLETHKVPFPKAINVTTAPFLYTPDQLVVDENGRPLLIDRGWSWEFPFSLHRNYSIYSYDAAIQYPYRVEFMLWHITNPYWDNDYDIDKAIRGILAKAPDGRYVVPFVAIVDTFYGNSVPYVDLVIPDTTFLERHGEHSLLDRPISSVNGPADNIEWPILPPLFDSRPFSDTIIELGYRLGLSAFKNPDGTPKYPNGMGDFLWKWQYAPGVGVLAGARGDGTKCCKGDPNPKQLEAYIYPGKIPAFSYGNQDTYPPPQRIDVTSGPAKYPQGVSPGKMYVGHAEFYYPLPVEMRYYRHVNKAYLEWAASVGFIAYAKPILINVYSEPVARFRLAAFGMWKGYNAYFYWKYKRTGDSKYLELARKNANPPNDSYGQAVAKIKQLTFWPIAKWYEPLSWTPDGFDPSKYPLLTENRHVTPWFYHQWENHVPWLRPLLRFAPIFMHPQTCREYGITSGDWVEFESWTGERGRFMVVCDETTRPGVVWYWKAKNVRPGVLAIPPNSPEATLSAMFNDLYSHVLPPSMGGVSPDVYQAFSDAGKLGPAMLNYDPYTGKTAWGDLRLRVVRVLGKGNYTVSYGSSDQWTLSVASAPADHQPPSLPYLQYNAYKSPAEMGASWYSVNQQYYQAQQKKQVVGSL